MRLWVRIGVVLAIALLASGCNRSVGTSMKDSRTYLDEYDQSYNLAIVGYNYTARYIATFSVNGHRGGNIDVSSPDSGGAGSSCCVSYARGAKTVAVRWQADACVFTVVNTRTKEESDEIYIFYNTLTATVKENFTTIPKFVEIHFYPDGKVEALVTDTRSIPRMNLRENREDRTDFVRCAGNKEPL